MGQWNMTVIGTGAHHNFKKGDDGKFIEDGKGDYLRTIDYDADQLFKEFVAKLEAAGHIITHASFTTGIREVSAHRSDGSM